MLVHSRSVRRTLSAASVALIAACQSSDVIAPTIGAVDGFASAVLATAKGDACAVPQKGVYCLADGTGLSQSAAGIRVVGPRGSYSLMISYGGARVDVVDGLLTSAKGLRIQATGARFSLTTFGSGTSTWRYVSGTARDLDFTLDASGRGVPLSINPPRGRHPFTYSPTTTQFGGDDWDFGGDEWDIVLSNGKMSITSADDWESPVKGKDPLQLQFGSGNISALPGIVTPGLPGSFDATIRVGTSTIRASTSCGAKLCDPAQAADINWYIGEDTFPAFLGEDDFPAFLGEDTYPGLLTEIGFPVVLKIRGVAIRSIREW